jgi:AbrB family looped-hinge helix DNA binding protein
MIASKVTSKGQITIPLEVRKRLKLKKGDRLEFIVNGERTEIRPAREKPIPFKQFIGFANGAFPGGLKEINAWIDDMRSDEPRSE